MPNFSTLEPAIDPNNRIVFLLDWELTMKCNLDCDYCPSGLYSGHDNSTKHPALEECLATVDFMYKYVDLYMINKPKGLRQVVLNVYGGEALHHPDVEAILAAVHDRYQPYKNSWNLTVTTTTNAIISKTRLLKIIPYINEFTVSYHTGATAQQKDQFRENLLLIKQNAVRQRCVVLMHPEPKLFQDAQDMIAWLESNEIRHLPRQLDRSSDNEQYEYPEKQITWLSQQHDDRSHGAEQVDAGNTGRSCCGGRTLCQDHDYKTRHSFVNNQFPDWYCSVNQFFLYVKQITKEVFVNKDCKMNFHGKVGPIGYLDQTEKLLEQTQEQLTNKTQPVIQCKKVRCYCGLCAPKAQTIEQYQTIMKKYEISNTDLLHTS